MAHYSPPELWKQWQKAIAGLMLAIVVFLTFNHFLMALIVFTFLFFIPSNDEGSEFMSNMIIFIICMCVIWFFAFFVGSQYGGFDLNIIGEEDAGTMPWYFRIAPWTWTDSAAVLFFIFWFFSFLTGVFGDPESRQIIGIFFILVSFFVFATGPGGENVGTAFFGQWWPEVNSFMLDNMGPLQDVFTQLTGTMQNAFLMLTNPVAYAHQIMEGSYTDNPTGKTGSYGVEITKFDISGLTVGQPAHIQIYLKNEGSFPAKDVRVSISVPEEYSRQISNIDASEYIIIPEKDYLDVEDMGFSATLNDETAIETLDGNPREVRLYRDIDDMRHQGISYQSFRGQIGCDAINKFNLREKSVPIKATVSYDYSVESTLNTEFISEDEWERLTVDGKLNQMPVASSISSAPVKLSISAMDQPMLVNEPFFVAIDIKAAEKDSQIGSATVTMEIPIEFFGDGEHPDNVCSGPGLPVQFEHVYGAMYLDQGPALEFDEIIAYKLIWTPVTQADLPIGEDSVALYCDFYNPNIDLGESPTKTYNLKARGEYRLSSWQTRIGSPDLGQRCCNNDDCGFEDGFVCSMLDKDTPGFCQQGAGTSGTGGGSESEEEDTTDDSADDEPEKNDS